MRFVVISHAQFVVTSQVTQMVEVDLPRWISSLPQRVAGCSLTGLANLAWAVATLSAEGQAEDLLVAIQEEVWRTNVSDVLKEGMSSIEIRFARCSSMSLDLFLLPFQALLPMVLNYLPKSWSTALFIMNTIIIPSRDSMAMSYQCILFDFNGANVEEKVLFTNKFWCILVHASHRRRCASNIEARCLVDEISLCSFTYIPNKGGPYCFFNHRSHSCIFKIMFETKSCI